MKALRRQLVVVLLSGLLLFLGSFFSLQHLVVKNEITFVHKPGNTAIGVTRQGTARLSLNVDANQNKLQTGFRWKEIDGKHISGRYIDNKAIDNTTLLKRYHVLKTMPAVLAMFNHVAKLETNKSNNENNAALQRNSSTSYVQNYRNVTDMMPTDTKPMVDTVGPLGKGRQAFTDLHIYSLRDPNSQVLESDTNLTLQSGDTIIHESPDKTLEEEDFVHRKSVHEKHYSHRETTFGLNCDKIVAGERTSVGLAKAYSKRFPRVGISPLHYASITNCTDFKRQRGYIEHPLSDTERGFPLAFGIMAYRDVEQVERLLRAIYRPHNYYCIHFDAKARAEDRTALAAVASCFSNVLLAPDATEVRWGTFSVLEMEFICLRHLWKHTEWKYYINLTGQEFPLKTNLEIVMVLKAIKGANLVDGSEMSDAGEEKTRQGQRTPHNIRPIKGSVHVALNRNFVDFCLHDNRSHDFQEWLKNTSIPDETFFASLNHNAHLGIPGSFIGKPGAGKMKPFFMRYKVWRTTGPGKCHGKFVRWICILGVEDVSLAVHSVALFANKFHLNYQYIGYDCLEEMLYRRTWDQYLQGALVDVTFYSLLDQVQFQLKKSNSSQENVP